MTLQLDAALQQELEQLAAERGLSADELAHSAIRNFVLLQRDLDAAVKRGDEDIAAGRLFEHNEVVSRIDRLFTQ